MEEGSAHAIHKKNFNKEIFAKMEKLLNILLDSVTEGSMKKLTLAEISQHLGEIEGTNEYGYDKLRVLWFVASCYD